MKKFAQQNDLVFLPGWGFSGRIGTMGLERMGVELSAFTHIFAESFLDPASLSADLLVFLNQKAMKRIQLVGWSMGAHLALDFARLHPDRVEALYLLSMRTSWPEEEIAAIRTDLHQDTERFMAGFYRKCFLGYKEEYRRFRVDVETDRASLCLPVLNRGLEYLASYRLNPEPLVGVQVEIIHGSRDVVAPVAEMPVIFGARQTIIPHAGHLVFFAEEFSLQDRKRKEAVCRRFSRAAGTYDEHADVQQEAAQRLAAYLPKRQFRRVLEIGCGTGNYTSLLQDKFPDASINALDFSDAMLDRAREKVDSASVRFLCLDGEKYLHETENDFDLITSNGAMQWFEHPGLAFERIKKRLTSDGLFLCSTFGPKTLQELQQGLDAVVGGVVRLPAASFFNKNQLAAFLHPLFGRVKIEELNLVRKYDSLMHLLHHLQKTGTSGWHAAGTVLTRGRLRKLEQWFADRHGYRLTYQIFICIGKSKFP